MTATLTRLTPPQWRVLIALHHRERAASRPAMSCRALLSQQDADVADLLVLEAAEAVEGVVPGSTVKLSTINWDVAARTRNYVSAQITGRGTSVVFGQPEIMVIATVGRGHRYTVDHVTQAAGVGDVVLREMADAGLIEISDGDGKPVDLPKHRGDIPRAWRLSLTRKGRSYLCRT